MLIFIDFVFYFVYKFYVIIKVIKYWLVILYYIDKIDSYVILNLLNRESWYKFMKNRI